MHELEFDSRYDPADTDTDLELLEKIDVCIRARRPMLMHAFDLVKTLRTRLLGREYDGGVEETYATHVCDLNGMLFTQQTTAPYSLSHSFPHTYATLPAEPDYTDAETLTLRDRVRELCGP